MRCRVRGLGARGASRVRGLGVRRETKHEIGPTLKTRNPSYTEMKIRKPPHTQITKSICGRRTSPVRDSSFSTAATCPFARSHDASHTQNNNPSHTQTTYSTTRPTQNSTRPTHKPRNSPGLVPHANKDIRRTSPVRESSFLTAATWPFARSITWM